MLALTGFHREDKPPGAKRPNEDDTVTQPHSDDYPYVYPTYPAYPTYAPNGMWTPPSYPQAFAPAPPPQRSGGRRAASLAGVAAIAAAAVLGVSIATGTTSTNGTGSAASQQAPTAPNSGGSGQTGPSTTAPGNGNTSVRTGDATEAQTVGVVDIYTRLKYQRAAAAGTGLVIDSDGYILTNNHVIEGSTTIRAVVVSTGKTYQAKVVGTAPTEDIAVIKLVNASGLQTAHLGDSDSAKIGDAVTGVGNAGGSGGVPSAASGTITALNETITASDETGTDPEKLNGVIVTNAPIQSGDSGGPLFNANDEVIGIDTAASTNGRTAGFAIPINSAMKIAQQIRAGIETSVIHIGYPAFLGVSVKDAGGQGALIATTEPGLPADKAGIAAGDVITALNGSRVTSSTTLRSAIAKVNPGDTVSISYTDANGASHSTRATLITGPAD
jgi:S1-C subfamily serine protease